MADRYWVGGTGNWDNATTTNWSATSGGASGASTPTSADNVIFDINSSSGTTAFTVTVIATSQCLNFTFGTGGSALKAPMTFAGTSGLTVYGDFDLRTQFLTWTNTANFVFAGTGSTIIATGGQILNNSITFTATTLPKTWTLQDNFISGSTKFCIISFGTLDLNNKSFSIGYFDSSNTTTRGINFGSSGSFIATNNSQTLLNITTSSNLTITGTPAIYCTYTGSTGTRSIITSTAITETQAFSVYVTGGYDTININGNVKNLNFTGFSGTLSNAARIIYGILTLTEFMTLTAGSSITTFGATSGTISINSLGKTFDFPITFDGIGGTFQLVDNLTVGGLGTNRTVTLTNGTLDLNNKVLSCSIFNTNNSNTRTIAFGTGSITLTGNAATIWTSVTVTGLTLSGTPVVNCTYSGATGTRTISPGAGHTEANSISFNITAGSDIIGHSNGATFKDLNFTGFSGTLTDGGATKTIYGDFTLSSTMTNTGSSSGLTFAATSGTKTFTTGGIVFNNPITISGVGGTFQLVGNLTMSTVTYVFTLTNGTFNANGYNVTIGLFSSSNSNTRALQMGGGIWTILGSGASAWNIATATGITLTNNNSLIDMTSTTAKTFAGGGLSYGTLRNSGASALTISGANTFANLRGTANITLTSSTTTTVSNTLAMDGGYGALVYLTSSAAANATISKASGKVYTTFCNISKITASGGATFRAPATPATSYGNVDGGTNSGWTFTAIGAADNPNPGGFSSFFS